ncbi:MAG: ABC transporter ATP-binding protein [Erysipelotrichaceae bacterium]|nr:ABC transporter ATP-binding protein [Erysipelotrichaceae bacterium]
MNTKERLFHYLKPLKRELLFALVLALLFVVSNLAQPFLLGRALDASNNNNLSEFYIYLIVSFVLALLGTFFSYIFEVIVSNASQKAIKNLRDDIYNHINSISIKDFDAKKRGDIVQLEIRDMEYFAGGVYAVFKTLMQGIFTIIITIIMMCLVNWILALGVILLSPLSVIMSYIISHFSGKYFKKQSSLQADVSSISLETLNNIDIIQSLNHEDKSLEEFKKKNEVLRKEGRVAQFSASWVNPSTRLVNNTIYVLIGIIGIIMLFYDEKLALVYAVMSLGRLSSFLSYTTQYSKPFNEISGVASEYESAKASFNRVNNFLNLKEDIDEGNKEISEIDNIEFKDVNFSYDMNKKLIEHLNLKINKGDKVAIVGPTGAGKTTLINLIMRFYDPQSGEVLVNNIPYKDVKKHSLRNHIGMVLQDTWIFKGTILDNIRYLKPEASKEEVIEASKKAHADLFINAMPNGYETVINAKEGLSEGEKQMIAIARVMLLNPEVVILDEATSNIDTRSEKLIGEAFDLVLKNKTSIVIAHRLSTIINADTIIVMKDGSIIETGNHQKLMKKEGFYYSLYSSQYK